MNKEIETLLSEQALLLGDGTKQLRCPETGTNKRCESERLPVQNTVQPGTYCFFCCQSR